MREYTASRKLPKDISMRVKRHFKYYYSRRPAFDESELLMECPPALRADVEKFVLKGTLGKLPLFANMMDPEFQSEIFPYIKPVSYAVGDVLFSKGEISRDLLFLLEGEIDIMSVKVHACNLPLISPRSASSSSHHLLPLPSSTSQGPDGGGPAADAHRGNLRRGKLTSRPR